MRLKSRNFPKTNLRTFTKSTLHTKFQLPNSILKGLTRGTNSKKMEKRPKNYAFWAARGCNGAEKWRSAKGTYRILTKSTYQISTS